MRQRCLIVIALCFISSLQTVKAQEGAPARPPQFASTSISEDRKITFKIHAPKAEKVLLASSDLPGIGQGVAMTKGDNGVWEGTSNSVPAGAYRYNFSIDGISVIDPKNPATSESNANTWSLLVIPGSSSFDLKDVPHGTVAQINYHSKSLNRFRRLHIYTPPGYEKSNESYPVFYLLHGAFDCDASWSSVGMAGNILDNLIAEGKAKPMIVVMPAGHTGAFSFGPGNSFEKQMDEFVQDFQADVRPMIESRYRVKADRANRAIAGLSMGGAQTLNIAFGQLADYAHVGVFSSGVFGMERGGVESGAGAAWAAKYKEGLDNAELRKGLKSIWFATGKEDFLLGTTKATVQALKDKGFQVEYVETEGGHTWLNWRDYLRDFAPKLFQGE